MWVLRQLFFPVAQGSQKIRYPGLGYIYNIWWHYACLSICLIIYLELDISICFYIVALKNREWLFVFNRFLLGRSYKGLLETQSLTPPLFPFRSEETMEQRICFLIQVNQVVSSRSRTRTPCFLTWTEMRTLFSGDKMRESWVNSTLSTCKYTYPPSPNSIPTTHSPPKQAHLNGTMKLLPQWSGCQSCYRDARGPGRPAIAISHHLCSEHFPSSAWYQLQKCLLLVNMA